MCVCFIYFYFSFPLFWNVSVLAQHFALLNRTGSVLNEEGRMDIG